MKSVKEYSFRNRLVVDHFFHSSFNINTYKSVNIFNDYGEYSIRRQDAKCDLSIVKDPIFLPFHFSSNSKIKIVRKEETDCSRTNSSNNVKNKLDIPCQNGQQDYSRVEKRG